MRVGAQAVLVLGLLLASTHSAIAYEAFQTHPGTRAMGMAGVFVAQADDSSAIWYNPAGAKSDAAAKTDLSVEFANAPRINDAGEYARGSVELKFLGGYTEQKFAFFGDANPLTIGAGYFLPYRTTININLPSSALDSTPYGDIDVVHRQVSTLIAAAPFPGFSWGATLDAMMSEVSCRDYGLCVNKSGPIGYGASLGAKYSVAQFTSGEVGIAAAWRSRIALRYTSRPDVGLGSVIEDFLPGRPESFALGINYRMSTPVASVQINGQAERSKWSATTQDASITDYQKLGLSAEMLIPLRKDDTFAIRIGANRADASGMFPDIRIVAAGVGYFFARHHSIDIALEQRSSTSGIREHFTSLSYSVQR